MYIYCDDSQCEERAIFCLEIPLGVSRPAREMSFTNEFVCQGHLYDRLKSDEWTKIRTLYIPQ